MLQMVLLNGFAQGLVGGRVVIVVVKILVSEMVI